mgnify:CR=1 FL=1
MKHNWQKYKTCYYCSSQRQTEPIRTNKIFFRRPSSKPSNRGQTFLCCARKSQVTSKRNQITEAHLQGLRVDLFRLVRVARTVVRTQTKSSVPNATYPRNTTLSLVVAINPRNTRHTHALEDDCWKMIRFKRKERNPGTPPQVFREGILQRDQNSGETLMSSRLFWTDRKNSRWRIFQSVKQYRKELARFFVAGKCSKWDWE